MANVTACEWMSIIEYVYTYIVDYMGTEKML